MVETVGCIPHSILVELLGVSNQVVVLVHSHKWNLMFFLIAQNIRFFYEGLGAKVKTEKNSLSDKFRHLNK